MKKILLFLLFFLPVMANADDSGSCGEHVTYYYSEESQILNVSGTGPMTNYESEWVVPWQRYKKNIKEVIIDNGVTTIGDRAFYTCAFSSISIPESITSIGLQAFFDSQLTSISLSNGLKNIGDQAFYSTKLSSITIPSSVTSIGDSAFGQENRLSSIVVEDGNSIYDSRNNCNAIIETASNTLLWGCYCTVIPESIKTIGNGAFNGCVSLLAITIPNNVTSIGNRAFAGCSSLTSITIPQSVVSIGDGAFSGCALWNIIIPENVKHIEDNVFQNCRSLETIKLPNGLLSIGEGAFQNCIGLSSINIPEGVTTIGNNAFAYCKELVSVIIPNSVTYIGNNIFYGCSNLSHIKLSDKITSIEHAAFGRCVKLETITLPNEIISIGKEAFGGCTSLRSIAIPRSLKRVGTSAFYDCSKLSSITIEDGTESLDFDEGDNFIGCSLESVYLGRNMKYITNSPFRNNIELKTVILGDYITELGDKDFIGLTSLTSLELPHSLKKIGSQTFYGCKGLTSLTIPNSVTEIGKQAFDLCTSLKYLIIESGTEELAFVAEEGFTTNTFSNSPLEEITIGRNFSFASVSPFSIQDNLSTITIGEKVTTLDDNSFIACPKLVNVTSYSEVVPTINEIAFTPSYISNATLHVPYSLYEQYKVAKQWKDFGKILNFEGLYNLVYIVDGNEYKKSVVEQGAPIVAEDKPTKEGYTFSGWSEIPETMPAHDVTITGTFSINKYKLTYMADGDEYKSFDVEYGTNITPEPEPEKEGYTFSGWSEIPETMPAHDVTVTGTFNVNKYKLTYKVDDTEYKVYEIEYGATITTEAEPEKEGYTFSGWSEIPETMPAHDVTVTGTFSINSYKLTYMLDNEVYKEVTYEYGATITPEPTPEGNYASFEWEGLPETMPAKDVVVHAKYTTGINEILMSTGSKRIYSPNGKQLDNLQKGANIIRMKDGTTHKVMKK